MSAAPTAGRASARSRGATVRAWGAFYGIVEVGAWARGRVDHGGKQCDDATREP